MTKHNAIAGLDLPDFKVKNQFSNCLSSALTERLKQLHPELFSEGMMGCASKTGTVYWNANYLVLDRVRIFQNMSLCEQTEVLQLCSWELLEEVYWLKKAGVGYMSKMVSLADTTEEQMLYALFSSDEVSHLVQVSRFLPALPPMYADQKLLELLTDIGANENKQVLLFVFQVVIKGWSLAHYRSLARDCQNSELSFLLLGFLQAESRHHDVGVRLFHRLPLTASSQKGITEILTRLLETMQLRSQRLVKAIEKVKGGLSRQQRKEIFEQLDTENQNSTHLKFMRSLMRNPNSWQIIQQLEAKGVFQPLSIEKYL
ncbi:hypothetical protein [Calothrix sp. PCC 6303]|uniref:hypothetical protein n=1 Tax=Calothrix sp. PCC 6303 TaxID=1170562 RepID=UPI0002E3512B|nr:hypothetical protein [Calothrix sp. PCC 6303]